MYISISSIAKLVGFIMGTKLQIETLIEVFIISGRCRMKYGLSNLE